MHHKARPVLARCCRCGVVEIDVAAIVVHVDARGCYGLAACPQCRRRLWDRLEDAAGDLLVRLGARRVEGMFSPELLERRPGPPLTERDVRRFARALRRCDPAEEARHGR